MADPRGRQARPVRAPQGVRGRKPDDDEQTGPSMSTEPGWMAAATCRPHYLGRARGVCRNYPSMLLSFERPALAGGRVDASTRTRPKDAEAGRRYTPLHGP